MRSFALFCFRFTVVLTRRLRLISWCLAVPPLIVVDPSWAISIGWIREASLDVPSPIGLPFTTLVTSHRSGLRAVSRACARNHAIYLGQSGIASKSDFSLNPIGRAAPFFWRTSAITGTGLLAVGVRKQPE